MASRTTELALRVVADVDAGVSGLAAIETAGDRAAAAVDKVGSVAGDASSRLDSVGTSADNLDDKASKATGALGALSAGFELVGAEKYAGALQAAAMATDFASGVGQALNLVLELESLQRVKAAASSAAHTAATTAQSAATKAGAAAQWLMNAALSANPIGLVVVALAALAAGVVLAYQKSETFREVVDTAFGAAKRVVDTVVDTVVSVSSKVGDVIGVVRDGLPDAFRSMKERVVGFLEDALAPIQAVYDKITGLIDKLQSIDFPDLPKMPDLNPFGRANVGALPAYTPPAGGVATTGDTSTIEALLSAILAVLQANAGGITDPVGVASSLRQLLARADRILPA